MGSELSELLKQAPPFTTMQHGGWASRHCMLLLSYLLGKLMLSARSVRSDAMRYFDLRKERSAISITKVPRPRRRDLRTSQPPR